MEKPLGASAAVYYCVKCAIKERGAEELVNALMQSEWKLKRNVALLRGAVNHAYTGLRKPELIDGIEIMLKMVWDDTRLT
jgi:hypothetical protein